MKFLTKSIALATACIVALGLLATAQAAPRCKPVAEGQSGCIYLLLGGGFGAFSQGLNKLSGEMRKRNLPTSVIGMGSWRPVAAAIAEQQAEGAPVSPLVIVGHSWGATAVQLMVVELGRNGIPVDLMVTFDPVDAINIGSNLSHAINFYVKTGGVPITARADFRGQIDNINVLDLNDGIWHLNIDKNKGLHRRVIEAVVPLFEPGPLVQ